MKIIKMVLGILTFSLLGICDGFTQNQLNWKSPFEHVFKGTSLKVFSFDGAVYRDEPDFTGVFLPRFHQLIPLKDGQKVGDVGLKNAEFSLASPVELAQLDTLLLPNRPHVQWHKVTISQKHYVEVEVMPFVKTEEGTLKKLESFEFQIEGATSGLKSASLSSSSVKFPETSALASGKWRKITISESGIYKLTYQDLKSLGFSDPAKVSIHGTGGKQLPFNLRESWTTDLPEVPVYSHDGGDGSFGSGDYLLFYGQGPKWLEYDAVKGKYLHHLHDYASQAVYFLTQGEQGSQAPTIKSVDGEATKIVDAFDDWALYEEEQYNLIESGRQWYAKKFDLNTSFSHVFELVDWVPGTEVQLETSAAARVPSSVNGTFKVVDKDKDKDKEIASFNIMGVNLGDYIGTYAKHKVHTHTFVPSDPNLSLQLSFVKPTSNSLGWLDYLQVVYRRALRMSSSSIIFQDCQSLEPGGLATFKIEEAPDNLQVWDVSIASEPFSMSLSVEGGTASFKNEVGEVRHYVAFDPNGTFPKPVFGEEVVNQNIHGQEPVDMVIVTYPDYLNEANRLAEAHREKDGLSVFVVTPEAVFNEFSSGKPDVTAIRLMMKMFYDRAQNPEELPRYLLLMGDGSYDNRSQVKENTNRILTFQSENSLVPTSSYVSDDYYGFLDDHEGVNLAYDKLDIGIGRLPVKTVTEARVVVDKILHYMDNGSPGPWKNNVCFIGDDEDNNLHMRDANTLASKVELEHPEIRVERIFLDAFHQETTSSGSFYPEVNQEIKRQLDNGVLIMNYTGHGSEKGLAHERVVNVSDINSWTNIDKLPLWVTASCEFSRFDNPEVPTGGEDILLNPNGGGIGLLTTTRVVYSSPNFVLNKRFYDSVFEDDESGMPYRLGDVMRLTKIAAGNGSNKLNFTLLADPALMLNRPHLGQKILKINHKEVSDVQDTLKALSQVTLSGIITDEKGEIDSNFQGEVYATVFDKKIKKETLANDGGSTMSFHSWENVLFSGVTPAEDGTFEVSFVVPKDIDYKIGPGRISLYARDGQYEVNGSFEGFLIGGTNTDATNDEAGPQITACLNAWDFASGDNVNASPLFMARLEDENGMNLSGSGIGHEMVLIIDDDWQGMRYVLNPYYISEPGNYKKGEVAFKIPDLADGHHTATFKAWDSHNNSASVSMSFKVDAGEAPALQQLSCFPNPAREEVFFRFSHDRPQTLLNIAVSIYSLEGRLVHQFKEAVFSDSFSVPPVRWDLRDVNGRKVKPGCYLYLVHVQSQKGGWTSKAEKLLILEQ